MTELGDIKNLLPPCQVCKSHVSMIFHDDDGHYITCGRCNRKTGTHVDPYDAAAEWEISPNMPVKAKRKRKSKK